MRRPIAVVAFLAGTQAQAEPVTLHDEALRQAVTGKTVTLDTPFGTLPITYKPDGTMSGKAGVLALYLGSATDRGRWSVKGDRICQKFFKWFDGEQNCLKIRMDGRRITWRRDDGMTGTATIASNDATPPPAPSGLGVPVLKEDAAQPESILPPLQEPAIERAAIVRIEAALPELVEMPKPARRVALAALGPAGLAVPQEEPTPMPRARILDQWPAEAAERVDLRAMAQALFQASVTHRWCHAAAPRSATPDLVAIARQLEGATVAEAESAGCLVAEPLLPALAKAPLSAR